MELSELLALLHYEIQKSYDFAEHIARGEAGPTTSVLQVALERVELDIPVSIAEGERAFNRSSKQMQKLPTYAKRFLLPYSPEQLAVIKKGGIPKGEVVGRTLDIQLIGPAEKIDETRNAENIGRLRIVLKPVIK